jgi:hypothetical protein
LKKTSFDFEPVNIRISREHPWCRAIISRMMRKENKFLAELAKTHLFMKNIKKQMVRMLFESGFSYIEIERLMSKKITDGKQIGGNDFR